MRVRELKENEAKPAEFTKYLYRPGKIQFDRIFSRIPLTFSVVVVVVVSLPRLNGKCELKLLKHNAHIHRQISNLLEIRLRLIFVFHLCHRIALAI